MAEAKRHTPKSAIKLGRNEVIEEYRCPKSGGILVTNFGPGIEVTFCVDCDYDDYDYSEIMGGF